MQLFIFYIYDIYVLLCQPNFTTRVKESFLLLFDSLVHVETPAAATCSAFEVRRRETGSPNQSAVAASRANTGNFGNISFQIFVLISLSLNVRV